MELWNVVPTNMFTIIVLPTILLLPFSQDSFAGTRLHISSLTSTIIFVKQLTLKRGMHRILRYKQKAKYSTESGMQVSYISSNALVFQADYLTGSEIT